MFAFKTTLKLSTFLVAGSLVATGANALYNRPDRHVTIVNNSDDAIVELYATSRDTWEDDILGTTTLWSGYQIYVNIDDHTNACVFTFRAVFNDDSERIYRNINVCAGSEINFS